MLLERSQASLEPEKAIRSGKGAESGAHSYRIRVLDPIRHHCQRIFQALPGSQSLIPNPLHWVAPYPIIEQQVALCRLPEHVLTSAPRDADAPVGRTLYADPP